MQKFGDHMVVFDFLATYHEKGRYDFKIVLDKKKFKHGNDAIVTMFDPSNKPISLEVNKWGRKLNCSFVITDKTPDGICVVNVELVTSKGQKVKETLQCWVIK